MREWSILNDHHRPLEGRVRVPFVLPDPDPRRCSAKDQRGLICTRATGHTGRHVAALSSGTVAAVWNG